MKKLLQIIAFCSILFSPVFAGTWTYNVQGYMDFKTQALRDTTYNVAALRITSTTAGGISKINYAAQTGTTTASAFYRLDIDVNYTVGCIEDRNAIDTAINNVLANANVKGCKIDIKNTYCKQAEESPKADVVIRTYTK